MKIANIFFRVNFSLCIQYDLFRSLFALSFKIKCLMFCYTYIGIDDQDTFNLEMKGFLQELQCPYLTLTKSIDSLSHHDNRLLLLNYLLSELQTSRLLMEEEKQDVAMVICLEVEVHDCIRSYILIQHLEEEKQDVAMVICLEVEVHDCIRSYILIQHLKWISILMHISLVFSCPSHSLVRHIL